MTPRVGELGRQTQGPEFKSPTTKSKSGHGQTCLTPVLWGTETGACWLDLLLVQWETLLQRSKTEKQRAGYAASSLASTSVHRHTYPSHIHVYTPHTRLPTYTQTENKIRIFKLYQNLHCTGATCTCLRSHCHMTKSSLPSIIFNIYNP